MGAFSEFDLERQPGGMIDPFSDQPFDGDAFSGGESTFFSEQAPPASAQQHAEATNNTVAAIDPEPAVEHQAENTVDNMEDRSAEEAEAKKRAEHEASEEKGSRNGKHANRQKKMRSRPL